MWFARVLNVEVLESTSALIALKLLVFLRLKLRKPDKKTDREDKGNNQEKMPRDDIKA